MKHNGNKQENGFAASVVVRAEMKYGFIVAMIKPFFGATAASRLNLGGSDTVYSIFQEMI